MGLRTFYEWWIQDRVQNTLSGIPGSEVDPMLQALIDSGDPCLDQATLDSLIHGAVLPDDAIVDFLRSVPAARDSVCRLLPTMTAEEQERILRLLNGPGATLKPDPSAWDQTFMTRLNGVNQYRTGPGPLKPGDPRRGRSI